MGSYAFERKNYIQEEYVVSDPVLHEQCMQELNRIPPRMRTEHFNGYKQLLECGVRHAIVQRIEYWNAFCIADGRRLSAPEYNEDAIKQFHMLTTFKTREEAAMFPFCLNKNADVDAVEKLVMDTILEDKISQAKKALVDIFFSMEIFVTTLGFKCAEDRISVEKLQEDIAIRQAVITQKKRQLDACFDKYDRQRLEEQIWELEVDIRGINKDIGKKKSKKAEIVSSS